MSRARAPSRARARTVAIACAVAAIARSLDGARASTSGALAGRPGARPWIIERAELHGLSANALEEASSNVETIASRDCFVVARDGALVHESYYGGSDANTQTSADGIGKLALVVATGVALQQGLLELDAPLSKYAVRSAEEAFGARVEEVSVRQLLAQTHGGGTRTPGTAFELDDPRTGPFLDIIGDIIESRSGLKLADWARVNVAEKLGAPEMFASSSRADGAEGASLWRDLQMTCRDAAKLGQLFVNQGRWMSSDGSTRQMFDPSFAVAALSVSYPELNQAHGFTTWLHVPVSAKGTECCAPRTVKTACGMSSDAINGPILGKNAPHAPVAVSLGDEGSMIFMLPETRTVVVTLGRTTPGSPACPAAPSDVVAKAGTGRRDDAYLLRTMWSAMGGALKPLELDDSSKKSVSNKEAALEHDWHRWEEKKAEKHSKKHGSASDVASEGSSESTGILDAVREAIVQVMGSPKDDGMVHDGHATYEVPDGEGGMSPTTFARPAPKPLSPGDEAANEYKRRQIDYARDMQEREYKKFEQQVQKEYRDALKTTREKYQTDMRAAQKEKSAAVRAQKEDAAAAEYLDAVNKIEQTGSQALEQLDSWRKSTLPPLIEDGVEVKAKTHAVRADVDDIDEKPKSSMLGSSATNVEDLEMKMKGITDTLKGIAQGGEGGHHARYAALGDARKRMSAVRGSCVCGCPNTKASQATCFDIDASALGSTEEAAEACSSMHSRAGLGCPHTGIVQQCGEVIGKRGTSSEDLECRQVRRCPRTKEDAAKTAFLAAVFDCRPTRFAECTFVAQACAHSHVIIKPAAIRSTEHVEVGSELSRAQAPRRAAHRFPEHEHAHLHGNAMQRWFQNSSAEVSLGLVMAVLTLALITIARKYPSAVTGGDPFGSPPAQKLRKSPERVPLLVRPKPEKAPEKPKKQEPERRRKEQPVPTNASASKDSARIDDVVQRFPRPIKVPQAQSGEVYESIVGAASKPEPAAVRVPVVEQSEDDSSSDYSSTSS